jgi:sulfate/thiosulfate transport system substrate-binding protein
MRRISAFGVLILATAVALAGCGGTSSTNAGAAGGTDTAAGGNAGAKLTLVAYSTPKEAYEALIPAFEATPEGKGVSFDQAYGASGEQSRAVEAGLPASVVAFSLEPDMTRLVDAGLVADDWNSDQYKGMVTDSVVVFVVRKGNPKGIKTWDDVIEPGIEVITPNPFTSGGARWNLMAAYGAQIELGKSEDQALQFLHDLLSHTPVQDKSAREALQTFVGGKGDVMLAYENEAITAQQKGEDVDYVIPDQTILIENPIAVLKDAPPAAQAFVDFLRSDAAQKIYAEKGYRPVVQGVGPDFTQPSALFTIEKFGGWGEVKSKFFDPDEGLVAKIEQDLGVSTDSG